MTHARGILSRIALYLRFTRPFTLLPPLLGVISGAITAWGSASNPHVLAGEPRQWTWPILGTIVLGSTCAALLNAASNVINQVYDLENDRVNKPNRPNVGQQVMDWAIQAHGGGGVSDDFPLAWMYSWNRTLRLADGPDEVHRNQLAKLELAKHLPAVPKR